jgi:flagellar assembly protein FliH
MTEQPTIRLPRALSAVQVMRGPGEKAGPQDRRGQVAPRAGAAAGMDSQQARKLLDDERSQLLQARKALEDGLQKLRPLQEQMVKEAEGQLLKLAVDIARKVLMQELQAGRYEIDPIVKEALLHAPVRQDVVVHLHPEDWSRCRMAREQGEATQAGSVRFVADPSVQRAQCVLETAEGIVESSVEAHLEGIAEALKVPE